MKATFRPPLLVLRLLILVIHVSHAVKEDLLAIVVKGQHFVDTSGRERHFRGVNVVYKDSPWLPHTSSFHSNLSFVQDDIDLLASLGVNLIRLGVMWPGVVPEKRGGVDVEYLKRVREIVRMTAKQGIYTMVDPHQDEFNPRFCGEGAPDWWVNEFTTVTDFPVPVRSVPFGTSPPNREQCDLNISFSYIWTHDAAKAYQTFWERGAKDYGDFWAAVAAFFTDEPAVIGGELFNEPFLGDVFGNSSWRDNKAADLYNLLPFYQNVTRKIRAVAPQWDQNQQHGFAIAFEPTWPVGDQDINPDHLLTPTSGFTALPEQGAVYAFHYYSPPCAGNLDAYLDARWQDAIRLGAVPYASEFNLDAGDDESSQRNMINTFEAFESRQISYTGWQYKSYSGSLPDGTCTGCGNSFFNDDGTLKTRMAFSMGRPFAQAVAGHTLGTHFDGDSRIFTLEYMCMSTNGAPTEVVVPAYWTETASALTITITGDDEAKVEQMSHTGRHVSAGVEIRSWELIRIVHSTIAADGHSAITISIALKAERHFLRYFMVTVCLLAVSALLFAFVRARRKAHFLGGEGSASLFQKTPLRFAADGI